jgi:hypothetical protein
MAGNQSPIYSRVGDIQGPTLLTNPVAAGSNASYNGSDANTYHLYAADYLNGGFVQRIRLKANGTNAANVIRFWIHNGLGTLGTTTTAPQTPTATVSASVGTMTPGTYYMRVQALDAFGQPGPFSTEISNTVPSTGNNLVWGWSAPATVTQGVSQYRVAIGLASNQQQFYYANISGSSVTFTQNTAYILGGNLGTFTGGYIGQIANSSTLFVSDLAYNTTFIGEMSLPATTAIATAGTVDIDYPLNIALPPGWGIIAGLGTLAGTGANGWYATAIGGKY